MSTRKFIRNMFRKEAERNGVKASRYIRRNFDSYQINKYGAIVRTKNKCKGTHKRNVWRSRILLEIDT